MISYGEGRDTGRGEGTFQVKVAMGGSIRFDVVLEY